MSCSPISPILLILLIHSPVLISLQLVIILVHQSCQFLFFVSNSLFYFSRLFKFAPQPTGSLPLCTSLSGVVSQSQGGKKMRRRGWLRLKGWGSCLKQNGSWMPFIYCFLHILRAGAQSHNTASWHCLQLEAPLDKHMASLCFMEHSLTTYTTSLL